MRLLVALALLAPGAFGLDYVECSSGFRDNPVLDGGRSELEFADIDGDGNIDILSVGDHGNPYVNTQEHGVMVWFGDGQGNWSVCQYGDFGYGGIAVGDANGDGLLDVGYGVHHDYSGNDLGDQLLEVALGDGTGRYWVPWDDSLAREGQDWGMFATDFGDIDNDGDLDVGSISFGADDGIHVYQNLGTGAWRRSFGFAGGNSEMEFYFRDVNRDGNPDVVAAHGSGSVWFGDGAGGFQPANSGLPSSSYGLDGLSVGDADNDGGCDVSFANDDGGVEVLIWDDTTLAWQPFGIGLPDTGSFEATALCDMDADGFCDVCALGRGRFQVWTGDGTGNWVPAAAETTPAVGTYAALRVGADFDHNGRPDFAYWTREGSWPSDHNVAHAFRETSPAESLDIFPVFPRGGEVLVAGSVKFVDWWSAAPEPAASRVRLELSITGPGGPWLPVADSLRNVGRYQWQVPVVPTSEDCYLRWTAAAAGDEASALNPRPFTILGTAGTGEGQAWSPFGAGRWVRVRPNPASGLVDLLVPEDRWARVARVLLYDCCGQKVKEMRAGTFRATGRESIQLDIGELASGVYVVRVESGELAASCRLVRR